MINSIALPLHRRITQFLVSTTVMLVLACGGISTALAGPLSATDKDPKSTDLFFNALRVTFDCTALDTFELSPGLSGTLQGDTTDSPAIIPGYSCRSDWSEAGPEDIYQLNVTEELEFWAGLSGLGDIDLDIFLLNDCDTDSCLVGANTQLGIVLEPGTYYLIIDGYGTSTNNAGPYTLSWTTRWTGLPTEVCEPDYADPILCGDEPSTITASLFGLANHVQVYDCSPIIERGGEAWFAVTLDPLYEFTATATPLAPFLDTAIWIFDGCGNAAECLAFTDDTTGGLPEILRWVNDGEDSITVYLALDCYRAPEYDGAGAYELQFDCLSNVATEKTSWGSIRSSFR